MEDVIRIGLAGYGRSGRNIHANWLKKDSRFRIVAVADALPERRAEAQAELGCAVFEDYAAMLAAGGFDLFINATPSRFHVEASLAAFRAGCHVVTEKPSAPTVADFDRITAAADQAGKLLLPFQNSRFFPGYIKAKEIIDSGKLGRIIAIRLNWSGFARRWDWQTRLDQMAGNLFNTGPHPLDMAITLFGDTMPNVFCRMDAHHWNFGGDADNFCALTLYGDHAPTIELHISSFLAYPQGDQLNVQGTLGGLAGSMTELKWKYFDPQIAPRHDFWHPWSDQRKYCSETLPWEEYRWTAPPPMRGANWFDGIVPAFYDDLHAVLVQGRPRSIRLDQVRRQVAVLEEAHRQNPLVPKALNLD